MPVCLHLCECQEAWFQGLFPTPHPSGQNAQFPVPLAAESLLLPLPTGGAHLPPPQQH